MATAALQLTMAGGFDLSALLVDLSGLQIWQRAVGRPSAPRIATRSSASWLISALQGGRATDAGVAAGHHQRHHQRQWHDQPAHGEPCTTRSGPNAWCPCSRWHGPNMRRNVVKAASAWDITTIRRTGRLLTPSMPVSSSAFPARPPQPSWRIFAEDVADRQVAPARAPR